MNEDIRARFERETADHVMTVLHDDGLYRHLRFRREFWQVPWLNKQHTGMYWFEIVTAPGVLIFNGDSDSFTFRRIEDMFEFFRGPVGSINAGYWSEKLTNGRDGVMRYDRELLKSGIKDALTEARGYGELPDGLERAIHDDVLDAWDVDTEHGARRALMEFAFYVDESKRHGHHEFVDGKYEWVAAERPDFEFSEPCEWTLCDYDWWFLWALHGIVWGVAQYDVHHGRPVQVAAPRPAPTKPRSVVTVNLPEPATTGGAA